VSLAMCFLHIQLALSVAFAAFTNAASRAAPNPWASLITPGTALTEINPERIERITDADLERISIPVQYNSVEEEVVTFPERRPYITNLCIATMKGFLADAFVQMGELSNRKRAGFDWKRSVLFTLFGLLYAGVVEWIIYVDIFSFLCPNMLRFANEPWEQKLRDRNGQYDVVKQIVFDNFIHYTFIYYPIFYGLKEIVQGPAGLDISASTLCNGLKRYRKNMLTDLSRIWMFSIPSDLLLFTIPMWLRMPVNHALGFIWTMALSFFRGDEQAPMDGRFTKKALQQQQQANQCQDADSPENPTVQQSAPAAIPPQDAAGA